MPKELNERIFSQRVINLASSRKYHWPGAGRRKYQHCQRMRNTWALTHRQYQGQASRRLVKDQQPELQNSGRAVLEKALCSERRRLDREDNCGDSCVPVLRFLKGVVDENKASRMCLKQRRRTRVRWYEQTRAPCTSLKEVSDL